MSTQHLMMCIELFCSVYDSLCSCWFFHTGLKARTAGLHTPVPVQRAQLLVKPKASQHVISAGMWPSQTSGGVFKSHSHALKPLSSPDHTSLHGLQPNSLELTLTRFQQSSRA